MHSPFPGMDPYLESAGEWLDFHAMFLASWRESLIRLLPEPYEVWIDEHVQLVGPPGSGARLVRPDLAVSRRGRERAESRPASGVATLEPVTVPLPALETEDLAVRYLKILKRPERSLVTALELLSPANKREPGRSEYVAKRNVLRRQGVHLVELDLLVQGHRLPMGGPLPRGDYYALVLRGDGRSTGDVYAWTVRQPLPRLPIPLREPDPDVWSDLGAVFATAYERGAYARLLRYGEPPELPLGDEDRAWVMEQARRRGA
jgi:hypothetical protein